VANYADFGCPHLTARFIPASVERLGAGSFEDCDSLSAVTIESGSRLTSMGDSAFHDCYQLQVINLPPNLEQLNGTMFHDCNLSVLPLGSLLRLSSIGVAACQNNRKLRSVLIPGSVVNIISWAFNNCVSLSEVDFVLPSKLDSIGLQSFGGCTSLTRFRIVGSVTGIASTFLAGSGVREVSVDGDNAKFDTIEGFLVNRGGTRIVWYFANDCDVRIGANIETVGGHSFSNHPFLRSVRFESGSKLKEIEPDAFEGCGSLERVQFGGPYPTFGICCFRDCSHLSEVLSESAPDRDSVEGWALLELGFPWIH
jgi:hypothetical protein